MVKFHCARKTYSKKNRSEVEINSPQVGKILRSFALGDYHKGFDPQFETLTINRNKD